MLGDGGPASFVVSHCVTPVCVTTPLHSTMRAAANPMQQVYRNITKTIQFGNVRLARATFRSEKHRRPRVPSVGFSCVPAQYGLPDEKIEWQDNPSGASLKKRVRVVRLKILTILARGSDRAANTAFVNCCNVPGAL